MKIRIALALLACSGAATVMLLPSCGTMCTQIGCFDTLKLTMTSSDGRSIDNFSGTASYDGGVVSFSCPNTLQSLYACQGSDLILEKLDWPKVNVQVVASDGGLTGSAEIEPQYEKWNPNGFGCGPTCKRAVHSIQLRQ